MFVVLTKVISIVYTMLICWYDGTAEYSRFKKRYCPFKNILKTEIFLSSVTHIMTVRKTLVNHIGPTVVNTQQNDSKHSHK